MSTNSMDPHHHIDSGVSESVGHIRAGASHTVDAHDTNLLSQSTGTTGSMAKDELVSTGNAHVVRNDLRVLHSMSVESEIVYGVFTNLDGMTNMDRVWNGHNSHKVHRSSLVHEITKMMTELGNNGDHRHYKMEHDLDGNTAGGYDAGHHGGMSSSTRGEKSIAETSMDKIAHDTDIGQWIVEAIAMFLAIAEGNVLLEIGDKGMMIMMVMAKAMSLLDSIHDIGIVHRGDIVTMLIAIMNDDGSIASIPASEDAMSGEMSDVTIPNRMTGYVGIVNDAMNNELTLSNVMTESMNDYWVKEEVPGNLLSMLPNTTRSLVMSTLKSADNRTTEWNGSPIRIPNPHNGVDEDTGGMETADASLKDGDESGSLPVGDHLTIGTETNPIDVFILHSEDALDTYPHALLDHIGDGKDSVNGGALEGRIDSTINVSTGNEATMSFILGNEDTKVPHRDSGDSELGEITATQTNAQIHGNDFVDTHNNSHHEVVTDQDVVAQSNSAMIQAAKWDTSGCIRTDTNEDGTQDENELVSIGVMAMSHNGDDWVADAHGNMAELTQIGDDGLHSPENSLVGIHWAAPEADGLEH